MSSFTYAICLAVGFFLVIGIGSYLDNRSCKKARAAGKTLKPEQQPNYSGNFMVYYLILCFIINIILKLLNLIE
ncbi:MAG: hypothetical protein MR350_00270 [Alphaproteobacteria bacterium]|nr:hypothetical protein [Alphaproteobacteria bacterium]